jgi:hypothetical protein
VGDPAPERRYTPDEANAALPELTERLTRIRDARQVVLSGARALSETMASNGGGRRGAEYWGALQSLRRDLEAVNGMGILLRDADTGLVDFPATVDGADAFLCWRLGEPAVAHWHPVDTGFAGRRPL